MFFISLVVSLFLLSGVRSDPTRWHVPKINGTICAGDRCLVKEFFELSERLRVKNLDLSGFIFVKGLKIVNSHIRVIKPPVKLHTAPRQKAVIKTKMSHYNAVLLRRIFLDNDLTILGEFECVVTNSLPLDCHFIQGDMHIDEHFVIPPTDEYFVDEISGCLSIRNTKFTNQDLRFLNGLVHNNMPCGSMEFGSTLFLRVKNNPKLCFDTLFPALSSGKSTCKGNIERISKTFISIMVLLLTVWGVLMFHGPFMTFVNHRFLMSFWLKTMEPEMEEADKRVSDLILKRRKESSMGSSTTIKPVEQVEIDEKKQERDECLQKELRGREATSRVIAFFNVVTTFCLFCCLVYVVYIRVLIQ